MIGDPVKSEQIADEEASDESLMKVRIDFAERIFTNVQELSRFMDMKAGYLLSAVALMTAALGIVASKALDAQGDQAWHMAIKAMGLVSFVIYILIAFMVVYTATGVFKALANLMRHHTAAPELMFPLTVIQHYGADGASGEEQYASKLSRLSLKDMLCDYANQIIQVSAIYERKQKQINLSIRLFQYMSISWIITVLLLLAITVL